MFRMLILTYILYNIVHKSSECLECQFTRPFILNLIIRTLTDRTPEALEFCYCSPNIIFDCNVTNN